MLKEKILNCIISKGMALNSVFYKTLINFFN